MSERSISQNKIVFKGRLLPALPDNFVEPGSQDGSLVPWGPMPANPYKDEAVKTQQAAANAEFAKLYENPPEGISTDFKNMMVIDHVTYAQRRALKSYDGFITWASETQSELGQDNSEVQRRRLAMLSTTAFGKRTHYAEEFDLYERGQASVGLGFDAVLQTPIKNGEVAHVASPYWYRMQNVAPMREQVNAAALERSGTLYPRETGYYDINITPHIVTKDGVPTLGGLKARYKFDVGHMPTANDDELLYVTERQIAGYRVEEGLGFDQDAVQTFNEFLARSAGVMNFQAIPAAFLAQKLKRSGITQAVHKAIADDSLEDFVQPIETVVFNFKGTPERAKNIHRSVKHLQS